MHSYKQAMVLPILACILSLLCYLLFHASNDHGTIYVNVIATRERSRSEVTLRIRKGSVEATIPEDGVSLLGDTDSTPLPDYASIGRMNEVEVGEGETGAGGEVELGNRRRVTSAE